MCEDTFRPLLALSLSLANPLSSPPPYQPILTHWLQTKITHSISLSLSLSLSAPAPCLSLSCSLSSRHVKPPQGRSNVKSQLPFITRRPCIPCSIAKGTLLHYLCTKRNEGAAKIPGGGNLSRDGNSPPILAPMVEMESCSSKLRNWM